jgi:hypothetical protein
MLPFYNDATMWGPQGDPNKERPRLKPGDRLSDGRVFMGDDPTAVLEAALQWVLAEMKPLEAKRDELLAKLHEVAPEKYGQVIVAVESETTPPATTTTTKPRSKRG